MVTERHLCEQSCWKEGRLGSGVRIGKAAVRVKRLGDQVHQASLKAKVVVIVTIKGSLKRSKERPVILATASHIVKTCLVPFGDWSSQLGSQTLYLRSSGPAAAG